MDVAIATKVHLAPLQSQVLSLLRSQGHRGVSGMDAMRFLGVSGGSLTKRLSELRRKGILIYRRDACDPLTKRHYSRWYLGPKPQAHA